MMETYEADIDRHPTLEEVSAWLESDTSKLTKHLESLADAEQVLDFFLALRGNFSGRKLTF